MPADFANVIQESASSTDAPRPFPLDPVVDNLLSRFEYVPADTAGDVLGGQTNSPPHTLSAELDEISHRTTADLTMDGLSHEVCAKLLPDLVSSHYSEELIRTCFELILVNRVSPVSLGKTLPAL